MAISEALARQLLYAAHEAWNRRDIDFLIDLYVDDLTYWSNFGGSPNGGEITITGKAALRTHVMAFAHFDCLSVPERFRFENGRGHVDAEFYMRDRKTGLTHAPPRNGRTKPNRSDPTARNRQTVRLRHSRRADAWQRWHADTASFLALMMPGCSRRECAS
jgi:ketosteroid isomerase-like protein